ncbi:DMT family transporter [Sphaerisporangium flaviroseum]|uniref:DMT family transporter n=1 Tax=Sphaerisporangium flaviroseum TaxID=509199 RepID=A0ABP7I203_9ACTN
MSQTITTGVRAERWALAAAAVTMLLWASAFVSIRSAAPHFSPGALALGRMLVGSIVLGGILLVRREGLPPRAAWPGILGSGLLWFGLYMVALNWGEHEVDAGTAALLLGIGPVLVALLGSWLLKEGISRRLLAGIAVAFAGTVVVGISVSTGEGSSVRGVLLCLLAAVAFAGGVVCQKPALRHASPLQATLFGCVVAAVACLPFAGQFVGEVGEAPASALLNVMFLGAFPTALAFTTWAYALSRLSAGTLGATTYVVPVLTVLISWIALGEVPALLTFVGGALCLAGVTVSRGRSKPHPASPAPDPVPAPDEAAVGPEGQEPDVTPVRSAAADSK